jgi:hypothetical protein
MDLFDDKLTVDEKLILFNTVKRALTSMNKQSTGYHYDLRMIKSEKFQTLEKVLCLLGEDLLKASKKSEYNKWTREQVFIGAEYSDSDTIKSVISGFVAS